MRGERRRAVTLACWFFMLSDVQRGRWEAYEATENCGLRAEKLSALDAFLDALAASPPADWFPWVRSLAEQVVDHGVPIVIRQPLFERAVFPALLAGYQAGLPGCARWLAGLSDHLRRCPACREQLPPEEATETALLWAAVRHDPHDQRSRRRLIDKIADRLRYSLHELPSGVLYGIDGASPEQCQALAAELEEFCRLVAQEKREETFTGLIRDCRFHFRAYHDYLVQRERCASYAEYLSQNPPAGER